METALWVLVAAVIFIGYAIINLLRSIDGKLNGLKGLLSTDGPDPGFTSYLRLTANYLSTIKTTLEAIKRTRENQ